LLLPAVDGYTEKNYTQEIVIPWPLVWQAIQPVEGEGCVDDSEQYRINAPLDVAHYLSTLPQKEGMWEIEYYHKRVLNIITTRAELRDLVEKARPK
jgi:hypothetical protein